MSNEFAKCRRKMLQITCKYFEKHNAITYLDRDVPLFISGGTLEEAYLRIKKIPTKQRASKKREERE